MPNRPNTILLRGGCGEKSAEKRTTAAACGVVLAERLEFESEGERRRGRGWERESGELGNERKWESQVMRVVSQRTRRVALVALQRRPCAALIGPRGML